MVIGESDNVASAIRLLGRLIIIWIDPEIQHQVIACKVALKTDVRSNFVSARNALARNFLCKFRRILGTVAYVVRVSDRRAVAKLEHGIELSILI